MTFRVIINHPSHKTSALSACVMSETKNQNLAIALINF